MRIFKSKLWKKMIISFLLIGSIPAILVGAFSYSKASETIQKKVNESSANELRQRKMSVEIQLTSVEKCMLQFIESPTVEKSVNMVMSGTEFGVFNDIEATISTLPTMGILISSVRLINTDKNWVVDSTGVYALSNYEDSYGPINKYFDGMQKKQSYWIAVPENKEAQSTSKIHPVVTLVQKNINLTNSCFAALDVPFSSFDDLISKGPGSGNMMIVAADGCVIYDSSQKLLGTNIAASNLIKNIQTDGKDNGNLYLDIDGAWSSVNYIHSSSSNWTYILSTSVDDMIKDSNVIRQFTITVCGVMALFIILASLFVCSRIYQPFRRLYTVLSGGDKQGSLNKGRDEVKIIEESVGNLMTNQSKLMSQIYTQSNQLKEYYSIKLLFDENIQQPVIFPLAPKISGISNACNMILFLIMINSLEGTPYRESDIDLLLYAVNNIVCEIFADQIVVYPVIFNGHQITILSVPDDYKDAAYAAAKRIQRTLTQQLNFKVSIEISRPIKSLNNIHHQYAECLDVLQYHILQENDSIIFVDDVNKNKNLSPIYPAEIESEILEAVKACDRDKCSEMINQFVENIFNSEANYNKSKIFLIRLVINLVILQEESGESPQANSFEMITCLRNFREKDEIKQWLSSIVTKSVIDNIEKSQECQFKIICKDTLDLIHKEYDTKLTLEDCAARLNYHPSYIRRVLKKELGINFREYLLQYRINVAKKWLVESEMKVSDIAEKLKYENTENFIRSFKKAAGVTPKQYRDQKINN